MNPSAISGRARATSNGVTGGGGQASSNGSSSVRLASGRRVSVSQQTTGEGTSSGSMNGWSPWTAFKAGLIGVLAVSGCGASGAPIPVTGGGGGSSGISLSHGGAVTAGSGHGIFTASGISTTSNPAGATASEPSIPVEPPEMPDVPGSQDYREGSESDWLGKAAQLRPGDSTAPKKSRDKRHVDGSFTDSYSVLLRERTVERYIKCIMNPNDCDWVAEEEKQSAKMEEFIDEAIKVAQAKKLAEAAKRRAIQRFMRHRGRKL